MRRIDEVGQCQVDDSTKRAGRIVAAAASIAWLDKQFGERKQPEIVWNHSSNTIHHSNNSKMMNVKPNSRQLRRCEGWVSANDSEVTREWNPRKPKISWQTWKWKMVISWCLGRVFRDACIHFFHWLTRWHGMIYAYLVWFIQKDSMLAFPGCSHIELLKQHASRSAWCCRPGEFVGIAYLLYPVDLISCHHWTWWNLEA